MTPLNPFYRHHSATIIQEIVIMRIAGATDLHVVII